MFGNINVTAVSSALEWLMEHNALYEDVVVNSSWNETWEVSQVSGNVPNDDPGTTNARGSSTRDTDDERRQKMQNAISQ